MRVEHEGSWALVASKGGAPTHPEWYANLLADPHVMVQDGPEPVDAVVRLVTGAERAQWWERSVAVFPRYAEYEVTASAAGREIPVFVAEPLA